MSPLLSALGSLQRKTPPPSLALVPQAVILAASVVCKPQGIGIGFLLLLFRGLPAEWQMHLPLGPALVALACGLGRLFALPPSTLHWQHA